MGLDIPSDGRIVMGVPVKGEAGLELKPLAGERMSSTSDCSRRRALSFPRQMVARLNYQCE
ncbi:MAG: hypothetical protein NVSMB26_24970 [Beijerinckiaceae bacterium]